MRNHFLVNTNNNNEIQQNSSPENEELLYLTEKRVAVRGGLNELIHSIRKFIESAPDHFLNHYR